MAYKLEISAQAEQQIDTCIRYIVDTLQNPSAAKAVLEDIACAYEQLEERAESVAFCEDPYLHAKGYRKLALKQHDYVCIYRVEKKTVYLVGFFHMLENYRTKL